MDNEKSEGVTPYNQNRFSEHFESALLGTIISRFVNSWDNSYEIRRSTISTDRRMRFLGLPKQFIPIRHMVIFLVLFCFDGV